VYITGENVKLILLVFSLVSLLPKSSVEEMSAVVKCGIAALCCVFLRCAGELPSTQKKMPQRKNKNSK
jgi:hypothetical protein